MSEIEELEPGRNPNRGYIIAAAVLVVVIVVATVLLITKGIPALLGKKEPTPTAVEEPVAAFTPEPIVEPTPTPLPSPTIPPVAMSDTDTPIFDFLDAGARPSAEWTGFFGQVLDVDGAPVEGVPVIVYRDGEYDSPPALTDQEGHYEIRLAEGPEAGRWTIQLLTEDMQPASRLFIFDTDENTETGIQQIQVIWQEIP